MIKAKEWRYGAVSLLCGTIAVAGLAHAATRSVRTPIERPVKRTPTVDATLTCQGGAQPLARVELIPDAVISQHGRERIEYHGEIVAHAKKALGVAWKAEIVDDRGHMIASELDRGEGRGKAAGDMIVTRALSANLPDGFYALRLRAAVTAEGEAADVLTATQHIEVRDGRWAEIELADWLARSRASQGFSEAEVKEMGLLP